MGRTTGRRPRPAPRKSGRRSLVLAASAIAPVALVALWLALGGGDTAPSPSPRSDPSATPSAESRARRPSPSADPREGSGSDLASLVERRDALLRERETRGGSDVEGYRDEDAWADSSGERTLAHSDGRDGPTPEAVEELQRRTEEEQPSEAELAELMRNAPPLPSPQELAELREQTAAMLDFPPDEVDRITRESNAKQPTPERLEILEQRLELERNARRQEP